MNNAVSPIKFWRFSSNFFEINTLTISVFPQEAARKRKENFIV